MLGHYDEWCWQATDRSLRWSWETVAKQGMVVVERNWNRKPERLPGRESASRKVGLCIGGQHGAFGVCWN
jgi:hypothetical protein